MSHLAPRSSCRGLRLMTELVWMSRRADLPRVRSFPSPSPSHRSSASCIRPDSLAPLIVSSILETRRRSHGLPAIDPVTTGRTFVGDDPHDTGSEWKYPMVRRRRPGSSGVQPLHPHPREDAVWSASRAARRNSMGWTRYGGSCNGCGDKIRSTEIEFEADLRGRSRCCGSEQRMGY